MKERLQKVLAHAGVASRRDCETLIVRGRVAVNKQVVTELGTKVDPLHDDIKVDGKSVTAPSKHVYLMLNKPRGYVSTVEDPQGRPTVLDLLPKDHDRLYPVGRLDLDSEGLLILTNDGEFTQLLLHPRFVVEKEYQAKVAGKPAREAIQALRTGVELDGRLTAPANVRVLAREREKDSVFTWLQITIHEGRKRQVRRMCEIIGHPVSALIRTRIGTLELGELKSGETAVIPLAAVRTLKALAQQGPGAVQRRDPGNETPPPRRPRAAGQRSRSKR